MIPSSLKTDSPAIQRALAQSGVTCFYHFTDKRNLQSIREHGLCPWSYLDSIDVPRPAWGGSDASREIDVTKGLQEYVHLSFCRDHPMRATAVQDGRIKDCVLLQIDPVVASWTETRFSDRNANSPQCREGETLVDLLRVRFDLVRLPNKASVPLEEERPLYSAEVMVKHNIPMRLITIIDDACSSGYNNIQREETRPSGAMRAVKFTGDRWRYHKECSSYYRQPIVSFFMELLQNSLDACVRAAQQSQMRVNCEVSSVDVDGPAGPVRRVQVVFEDNGCGMDKKTVEEGLLKIASTSANRTDDGRKASLRDCAGGFGLAKVLLFLGQDAFEIWTKTSEDLQGVYVRGKFGRADQEDAELGTLRDYQRQHAGEWPCEFSPRTRQHGTRICITANPWVLGSGYWHELPSISEETFKKSSPWKASEYVRQAEDVYCKNNLPIQCKLQGKSLNMVYDKGEHVCDLSMDFCYASQMDLSIQTETHERKFGALYQKATNVPSPAYTVVLQTLPDTSDGDHFLYCFEKQHGRSHQTKQITVVLYTTDENGWDFKVGDLLSGSRDSLTTHAQMVVDNAMQKFLIDPNLVKPVPESIVPLTKGPLKFSEWFDEETSKPLPENDPEYWQDLSEEEANDYLGNTNWRTSLQYSLFIYTATGVRRQCIPPKLRSVDALLAVDVMWLELFGAFLVAALDARVLHLKEKSEARGTPFTGNRPPFDVGFIITDDKEDGQNCAYPGPLALEGVHVFLLPPGFRGRPSDSCVDFKSMKKALFKLKAFALHQVSHLDVKEHGSQFIENMEELAESLDTVEDMSDQSWFHLYRRYLAERVMRDRQQGIRVPELLHQMSAIEAAAMFKKDSSATNSALQADMEKMRTCMRDAFGSRVMTGREARRPIAETLKRIADENTRLRARNKELESKKFYKLVWCRYHLQGTCNKGMACNYAHERLGVA
eukprot:TRINITY_DN74277_c0_g1_i1.p1 TRINITY_DN74277_c0_g1~~TRINITY_DN74277_c0_g1_i1.p1  ORF type:complete len:944 (-),score=119.29 TRINITY_DN74277_c0_g1_i1:30-2861(-)